MPPLGFPRIVHPHAKVKLTPLFLKKREKLFGSRQVKETEERGICSHQPCGPPYTQPFSNKYRRVRECDFQSAPTLFSFHRLSFISVFLKGIRAGTAPEAWSHGCLLKMGLFIWFVT